MWYKLATIISVEQFKQLLKEDASAFNDIKNKYRLLSRKYHPDVDRDPDANQNIINLGIAYQPFKDKIDNSTNPSPNTSSNPKPSPAPTPNTTVKDLTLDKADQLERLRPNQNPVDDFDVDTDKRIEDRDIKLIEPKNDKSTCVIEEEVFIQNLLTGLTGYAQLYFKKKIFTISQDTYGGNRSPLAPLQRLVGLTPPGRLGPNTQAYDPASVTGSPLGDFARPAGSMRDPFGNPTAVMPAKDKTVVWNTADVQSIMSSLEKIAQMPELQKYGAKEITNILRYPLLQVKSSSKSIDDEIRGKKLQVKRYRVWALNPPPGYKDESIREDIRALEEELTKLYKAKKDEKPDVEVVPFKEFYKLTELSRYYIYKGTQLNEVFCDLQSQLIKTLNNTLNTLGKMEKNKRLKDIYENARGKK